MGKIRILLADPQEIPRVALAALLDRLPDFEVVGQTGDGSTALELTARLGPDVLILDLPAPDGTKVIERARREHPATKVLVLSMRDDLASFHAAQASTRSAGSARYGYQMAAATAEVVCGGRSRA